MEAKFDPKAKLGEATLIIAAETETESLALQFWMNQSDMPIEYKHMMIVLKESEPE